MRLAAIALLLPLTAAAAEKAPPPPPPDAPADVLTPAQEAAQEMLTIYEEFCLDRFPSPDAIQAGIAAHHLSQAAAPQATDALLGRAGSVWAVATPKGHYAIAIEAPPHKGCAVTGPAADDEGIRAAFELAVEMYAQAHEYGMLQRPPRQSGQVAGRDAAVQIIGASPSDRPRQAFVNMGSHNPDGSTQLRLSREFAPPEH
jgi:hypothetical protein